MFEQTLPKGLSLLHLNAVFSRGDTAYVYSTQYPAIIDTQADVAEFLETATTTALNALKTQMSKTHPPQTGGLRQVREFLADLTARSALSLTIFAKIGELSLSFEFQLGYGFPMSFTLLQEFFGLIIPSFGPDLLRQFLAIAAANDFYFKPEAQGYVRKKEETPQTDPVREFIDLLQASGIGTPMRSRSGTGYSVIVTSPEQLAQLFGERRGSSPFGDERRRSQQQQQEIPPGYFVCKDNGKVMRIDVIVDQLQTIRKEMEGKLDRQQIYDFYAPEVLTALDLADVESGYYPLKDGTIEPIPPGYYWEGIVGEVSKIPEGHYVLNGNLKEIPEGHYFNYKTWSLEVIPEGFIWDWETSRLKPKETAAAE